MKATELRLGNLIKIGGNTLETYQTYAPTKVTLAILNEIAGENEERPDAELSVFMPIPITEEWLRKLNIIRYDNRQDIFYDGLFQIRIESHNNVFELYSYSEDSGQQWHLTTIEFVHQLQNLYYALTGEELQPSRLEKPGA